MDHLVTTVFVEQPLALHGSAKKKDNHVCLSVYECV